MDDHRVNSIASPNPEPSLGLDPRRLGDERYVRAALIAALGNYLDGVQADLPHVQHFAQLVANLRYLANMTGLHWAALLQSALLNDRFLDEREASRD